MSATHRTKKERSEAPEQCFTPPGLARAGVARLIADGYIRVPGKTKVLEPSCGEFAWVRALLGRGFDPEMIVANDIALRGHQVMPEFQGVDIRSRDFLKAEYRGFDLVIGNPPYNELWEHLRESLAAMSPLGVLAYVLPVVWFTAMGEDGVRQDWLEGEGKPSHQYLITPRPKFRETAGQDSAAYAMMVWAPGYRHHSLFSILNWKAERDIDDAAKKAAKAAAKAVGKIRFTE